MLELKKRLFSSYNGFSDKRIKNLEKGNTFIVDDRKESDKDARNELYLHFCMVYVRVMDRESVEVELRGNVPISDNITKWANINGASISAGIQPSLKFNVTPRDVIRLNELADLLLSIVQRGAPRYKVPSYKYVCPRTAKSLKKLETILKDHWGEITME